MNRGQVTDPMTGRISPPSVCVGYHRLSEQIAAAQRVREKLGARAHRKVDRDAAKPQRNTTVAARDSNIVAVRNAIFKHGGAAGIGAHQVALITGLSVTAVRNVCREIMESPNPPILMIKKKPRGGLARVFFMKNETTDL